MNEEPACIYIVPACHKGDPCEKHDNPLSCAAYKQMKHDGRLSLARRDGQVVLE